MKRLFQFSRRSAAQIRNDVDDEVRFHFDMRIETLVATGLSREAATDIAGREFGDVGAARKDLVAVDERNESERRRRDYVGEFRQDIQYGIRSLRRTPALTLTALLTLTLGIGATTAVFSVVDSLLFHSLSYPAADRVVAINQELVSPAGAFVTPGSNEILTWRDHARSLESIQPYGTTDRILASSGQEASFAHVVSILPSFLGFAGERATVGRGFVDADAAPGAPRVAMLSDATWRVRFGSDPGVLGRTIQLDGAGYVVIGVASRTLREPGIIGSGGGDIWLPMTNNGAGIDSAMFTIARLRKGMSAAAATLELDSLSARAGFQAHDGRKTSLRPPAELLAFRQTLLLLGAAVVLVLLVTLVNVAHLQLGRAAGRSRELAIRTALGAGRGRIIRQLVTESIALTVAGSVAGLAAGWAGLRLMIHARPANLVQLDRATMDWRIAAAMMVLSIVGGVIFGLIAVPRHGNAGPGNALKAGALSASSGAPPQRLRSVLVITEMAVAAILLVGAGLLIRSVGHLQRTDPGFSSTGLYAAQLRLPPESYPTAASRGVYEMEVAARLRTLAGVRGVTIASTSPPRSVGSFARIEAEGIPQPPGPQRPAVVNINRVSQDYFSVMELRIVKGATFTDTAKAAGQVIVNEGMARRNWQSVDVAGRRFRLGPTEPWLTVVGVVADASMEGVTADATRPSIYQPSTSHSQPTFIVRVAAGVHPERTMGTLIGTVDPRLPLPATLSVADGMAERIAPIRFTMTLLVAFTVLAVVLSAIGLYGVLAYAVQQRTREIGIRVALGATRRHVIRTVVQRGLALVVIGSVIGLIGARWATAGLGSMLYGVERTDLTTFAGGAIVLLLTALIACLVPALRALRVDPIIAIRAD